MSSDPLIVFGAFDRHNFGDLLFPHVAEAMLPGRELLFAGVAQRDLTAFGGHRVRAIASLASEWGDRPVDVFHAGGEILTVDAWQAAVMVLPQDDVAGVIGLYGDEEAGRLAWARGYLGFDHLAAYVVPRRLFRRPGRWLFGGVGGVALDRSAARLRAEVEAELHGSDFVGVRDARTLVHLQSAGIAAHLMPDPAVMVAELFDGRIRRHGESGEPGAVREAFRQGYLALQFSADFGDDATLAFIAAQLDRVAAETGLGIVLFRAGAAPWHDDIEVLRRMLSRLKSRGRVFESLDIWDICALIAGSRGICGSSLHGRILALDYGLPRVSVAAADGLADKQEAFIRTWDADHPSGSAGVGQIGDALRSALATGAEAGRRTATYLSALYRQRFAEVRDALD